MLYNIYQILYNISNVISNNIAKMDNKTYSTVNKIELYMITFGNHVVLAAISEQKVRNCIIPQIEHGIDTCPNIKIKPDYIVAAQCHNYPSYLTNCYLKLPHGKWPGSWGGGGGGCQANIILLREKYVHTLPSEVWQLVLDYL